MDLIESEAKLLHVYQSNTWDMNITMLGIHG